jgi:sulfite exporter TauE/SafE
MEIPLQKMRGVLKACLLRFSHEYADRESYRRRRNRRNTRNKTEDDDQLFVSICFVYSVCRDSTSYLLSIFNHHATPQRASNRLPSPYLVYDKGFALYSVWLLRFIRPHLHQFSGYWQVCAGIFFGLGIGLLSSLLGVAGGEMIIPTLIFAFGANIKTAGTASLLISFPTICVGLLRYAKNGAFSDRRPLTETVAPMGIGSIIGAMAGGLLVGIAPVSILKLMLGAILIISALRIFRKNH